jgi:excisionase family DNA binding protein
MTGRNSLDDRSTTSLETLLIDAREAARLLSVSESTLVRLMGTGGLPRIHIGRSVWYDPADVRAWSPGNSPSRIFTARGRRS